MAISKATTVRVDSRGRIVLPAGMRQALGIGPGDRLLVIQEEGGIILMTPEVFAKSTRGMLKGTWGRDLEEINDYLQRERDSWNRPVE